MEITPDGVSKSFKNIKGYYCDIKWVQDTQDEQRYAILTYNGTKSQTFIVFDTKFKDVYYKQEDGNSTLSKVFERYNGDSITFGKKTLSFTRCRRKIKIFSKLDLQLMQKQCHC